VDSWPKGRCVLQWDSCVFFAATLLFSSKPKVISQGISNADSPNSRFSSLAVLHNLQMFLPLAIQTYGSHHDHRWDIPEPPREGPPRLEALDEESDLDLIIVPGLGFDSSGRRLGQVTLVLWPYMSVALSVSVCIYIHTYIHTHNHMQELYMLMQVLGYFPLFRMRSESML
jgi:hypothetical protein